MRSKVLGLYSVRNHLLASYLFLLVVTLGSIIFALFLTTSALPEPANTAYDRLAPLVDFLTNPNLSGNIVQPPPSDLEAPNLAPLTQFRDSRIERLRELELNGETRVLLITTDVPTRQAGSVLVNFDTRGSMGEGADLILEMEIYNGYRSPNRNKEIFFGKFHENGREWVFSAAIENNAPDSPLSMAGSMIVVAEPRGTQSLQNMLADFGTSLAGPLFQAAFFGTVIAILLAVVISRTIAFPLQATARAATAVTLGDLDQRVPVTGPREVRSVAYAFNQMSAEVKATQQAQRDFLANVSHDLKTPLTSIQGYSQAIIDGAAKDPQKAAEIIHDEAGRLNRLVVELTDLARIQAGQFSMKHEPVDVGQIAASVAQKLAVVAEKKGVQLNVKAVSLPPIMGDGDRLAQVFTNLLSNAVKYTPTGGKVRVQTRNTFDGVEIVVRDTGIGIPEDDLSRIFERFYQVDKARGPARGTGLGLAITSEIITAHGGHIDVKSIQGKGTEFTVWLPSMAEAQQTPLLAASHAQAS